MREIKQQQQTFFLFTQALEALNKLLSQLSDKHSQMEKGWNNKIEELTPIELQLKVKEIICLSFKISFFIAQTTGNVFMFLILIIMYCKFVNTHSSSFFKEVFNKFANSLFSNI